MIRRCAIVLAVLVAGAMLTPAASRAQCAGPAVVPVINGVVPGAAPSGGTDVINVEWNGVGLCPDQVTSGGDTRT